MIGMLKGEVVQIAGGELTVLVGGVGYQLRVPAVAFFFFYFWD